MTDAIRRTKGGLLFHATAATAATLAVLFVVLSVVELRFQRRGMPEVRLEVATFRDFVLNRRVPYFEGRPHTVFGKPPFFAGRNSFGFNDVEWSVRRKPGVPRIACLGSSTTEGGNSDDRLGSFPYFLEELLEERYGRDVEVMNFGLAGWTTAEEVINWFLLAQDYEPDLVLLHEAANDVQARNFRNFRVDYVHYRKPWQVPVFDGITRLLVRHSDVYAWELAKRFDFANLDDFTSIRPGKNSVWNGRPESLSLDTAQAFRRNVLSIVHDVKRRGKSMALITLPYDPSADVEPDHYTLLALTGIRQHNEILREIARQQRCILIDIARWVSEKPAPASEEFLDLVHVTPQGNRWKAMEIDRVLATRWKPSFE
jgi:lysophospholipase L1-like esterase